MIEAGTKTAIVPEFTLSEVKMSEEQHMASEQLLNINSHECESSRQQDCADRQMSSQGDSESLNNYGTTNSHYYKSHLNELRDQIIHLETVNSKLVPDLENYEAEIYDLKYKMKEYQS